MTTKSAATVSPLNRRYPTLAELANPDLPEDGFKGIRCPKCHCQQFRVDATRNVVGAIARYRVCRACGHRWRTNER